MATMSMFIDTNEEYEITKARLNPGLFNSVRGIYWSNSYLYCINVHYARLKKNKLFFSREQNPSYSSWGYETNDDEINGQLTRYSISSTNFEEYGIDLNNISPGDNYNFLDPNVEGDLVYMVPDSTGVRASTTLSGLPEVYSNVVWRRSLGSVNDLRTQNGISVIKVSYYADEGIEEAGKHNKYIKLVYNTSDPATVGFSGGEGVIIVPNSGYLDVAYDSSSEEVQKLKNLFGTPIDSDSLYASQVYEEELSLLCRQVYLSQTKSRKVFLREGQPNMLRYIDLLKSTKYTEFNTALLSLLTAPTISSTVTSTYTGGY